MSLHLYAITTSQLEVSALKGSGVGGAELRWLEAAGFRALVSSASPEKTVEAALEHHAVVADVHTLVPTLPARFAAPLEASEIAEHLRTHEAQHLECLARIGDALEFGVRIASLEAANPVAATPVASGAAFLRARGEALRLETQRSAKLQAVSAQLKTALSELLLEVRGGFSAELYRASYLFRRRDLAGFRQIASGLSSFDGVRVSWHGPFPPYSFTSAGLPAGGSS